MTVFGAAKTPQTKEKTEGSLLTDEAGTIFPEQAAVTVAGQENTPKQNTNAVTISEDSGTQCSYGEPK